MIPIVHAHAHAYAYAYAQCLLYTYIAPRRQNY